ncbi:MAG TPA: porin [Phycisphaerales bacterium]|nr:porin [Phycisphaerales bacterium]HMP38684.1 porin [Phycisphaerales bacterium]
MSLTHRVGLLAGAATLALTGVGLAESRDAGSEALAEIAKLRTELAELKSKQGDSWLTEQRASEIRALVQDVLADADTRASLQSSGMTAGYDRGFFLASPDGNFRLRVEGQIQFRYILNYRDLSSDGINDRWTSGFENSRTKLTFSGNIVDPSWTYRVQGNFSRASTDFSGTGEVPDGMGGTETVTFNGSNNNGGSFTLEDAWLQKDFDNGMYVRFGQYKPPFLREELVNSKRQLLVDRSLVNQRYNQGYSQGVSLGFESDMFRGEAMFSDGIGDNNAWGPSYANSGWNTRSTEWAVTARAEFLVAGNWRQFDEFTSFNGESFGLLIGGAMNWQRPEFGTADNDEGQALSATVDASAKFGGANLYGAFVWFNPDIGDDFNNDRNELAIVVQGGFFIVPDTFEIFARYEWADPDTDEKDLNVLTVGANWYLTKSQSAKFTVDVGFSLEDFDSFYASPSVGWLQGFNETQIVARAQFQLLF